MDVLRKQIDYYRARSGEYDEWFYRKGRYNRGAELNEKWFEEVEICMRKLRTLGRFSSALELACGTGIWTRELAEIADRVEGLDASSEVLAINRSKLESATNVFLKQVDLFEWEPKSQYDLVSFTFWLSHVPPHLVGHFLEKVYAATKPGGTVWIVDSRQASTGTAVNQSISTSDSIQTRTLNDGSTYEIVKIYYDPHSLSQVLERSGFTAAVNATDTYFTYAVARR